MKIEKIWGTTECLAQTPLFELHRLDIKPLHRCSMHAHQAKWGLFYVLDGKLYVDEWLRNNSAMRTRFATEGMTITTAPGLDHQFRTGTEGCMALEMYFLAPLSEDIIRRNIGGPVNE